MVTERDPRLLLLRELEGRGYQFTAVTPATHEIVLARPLHGTATLRDIFGWSRPFTAPDIDQGLLDFLEGAQALASSDGKLSSRLRVATLGRDLFLHSAFPTDEADAVFFGPDTYRFASFIRERLAKVREAGRIVDMGAGSGAGGIVAARLSPSSRVTLVDSNAGALDLAKVNAAGAGLQLEFICSDKIPIGADVVIANPPYMMDSQARTYRDGGALLGGAVALEWVEQALASMAPGGTMLLYTGVAFRNGSSPLLDAVHHACSAAGASLTWQELDPDVFGEELRQPAYADVERIAAVGLVIELPSGP